MLKIKRPESREASRSSERDGTSALTSQRPRHTHAVFFATTWHRPVRTTTRPPHSSLRLGATLLIPDHEPTPPSCFIFADRAFRLMSYF